MLVAIEDNIRLEETQLSPSAHPTDQAIAVLHAMSGRLYGRLEREGAFRLEYQWSGPVPCEVAEQLHDAGLIEIDETAPIDDAFAFRISAAGLAFLNSISLPKRRAAD
jgi:hypothetical protein